MKATETTITNSIDAAVKLAVGGKYKDARFELSNKGLHGGEDLPYHEGVSTREHLGSTFLRWITFGRVDHDPDTENGDEKMKSGIARDIKTLNLFEAGVRKADPARAQEIMDAMKRGDANKPSD
jgi:hypothetical protein